MTDATTITPEERASWRERLESPFSCHDVKSAAFTLRLLNALGAAEAERDRLRARGSDVSAYYNEIDPFAAAWLRELIKAGHIAPGEVDERSIADVMPSDIAGFTQCHFFAGIGVWSYALRQAGWPDDRPIWTGSCPCPPFSVAGKKKTCPVCGSAKPLPHAYRTGIFRCTACGHDWYADGRHLWPEFYRLLQECHPLVALGEQVAGSDGHAWGDLVQATLELENYAVGRVPFGACSVGAPNIRQRLYWVACHDPDGIWGTSDSAFGLADTSMQQPKQPAGERAKPDEAEGGRPFSELAGCCDPVRMADTVPAGRPQWGAGAGSGLPAGCGGIGGLGHSDGARLEEFTGHGDGAAGREEPTGSASPAGEPCRLDNPKCNGRGTWGNDDRGHDWQQLDAARHAGRPGPVNGHWRDADWLLCKDGKWRAVEPGTFPLAYGSPARVGRLRGYGNAINAEQAVAFIEAFMEIKEHQPCQN